MNAIEQLSSANKELMAGNEQLKEALGKYYRKEIEDSEVAGLLERYPFDFDNEETLFGEVENGEKVPLKREEMTSDAQHKQDAREVALIEHSNDFDDDCPR